MFRNRFLWNQNLDCSCLWVLAVSCSCLSNSLFLGIKIIILGCVMDCWLFVILSSKFLVFVFWFGFVIPAVALWSCFYVCLRLILFVIDGDSQFWFLSVVLVVASFIYSFKLLHLKTKICCTWNQMFGLFYFEIKYIAEVSGHLYSGFTKRRKKNCDHFTNTMLRKMNYRVTLTMHLHRELY